MATALAIGSAADASAIAFDPSGYQARNDKSNPFRFMPTAERLNTITQQKINNTLGIKSVQDLDPDIILSAPYSSEDQMRTCGVVYGPHEENWFYTMVPLYDELPGSNEYWKNVSFTGVIFTLYNEKAEKIGSFTGNVPLIEGALKCQSVQVDLSVTQKFYNLDDKYEITIAANYNPLEGAGAKQVTYSYSLNNKEEAQDPICTIPGMPAFETNIGTNSSENFIIMFMDLSTWPGEAKEASYSVYTKAGYDTNGPQKIQDFPVISTNGSEIIPMQMTANGNKLYAASAVYEKPLYGEGDDDTSQNGNTYVITLYQQQGSTFKEIKTTKVPVPDRMEGFVTSEVSLGSFRGTGDINFDFGDGVLPCYVLRFFQTDATNNVSSYYAIIDSDGNEINRFGENNLGVSMLSNLDGHEEQYAFLTADENGNGILQMMDWPSLKLGASLPVSIYDYDSGETFNLSNNIDRCLGKGGFYYVCSSANGVTDDKNTIHRIAYFDGNGELDHIDNLVFKSDVQKVLPWIDASILDPYLFHSDKNFEYLAWLQRTSPENPAAAVNVIAIVDAHGNIIAEREYKLRQQRFKAYVSNPSSGTSFLCIQYDDFYGEEVESRNELISLPINKFEGEGTVENPYLIKTYGDFNRIRNNLTSHFRLTNDIDGEGRTFLQIPGVFNGSLDGAGHQVRNMIVSGNNDNNGMFYQFGDEESSTKSFLKDITFNNLSMHITAQSSRIKADGLLAYQIVNSRLDNVHLLSPRVTTNFNERNSYANPFFGGVAARVNGCSINECSVLDADFNLPNSAVGGIGGNFISNGSEINACAFTGKIIGKNNVGGIAGNVNTTTNINDVHVKADITGTYRVGGVLGFADQDAAFINRALVEGTITGEDPFIEWVEAPSDPNNPQSEVIAVQQYTYYLGGIVGDLYNGTVNNSLVALDAISTNPEKEGTAVARIVGAGTVENCYALSTLPKGEDEYSDGNDVDKADLDTEWFTNQGFAFDGNNLSEPWVLKGALPTLHFEATAAQYVAFLLDELKAEINTTETIEIILEGFTDPAEEGFNVYADNEQAVQITEVMILPNGNVGVTATFNMEGNYTITATCGNKTATLPVTITDIAGIGNVTANEAKPNDPVFNLQGIKVGTRAELETLPAGFYIVGGQKIIKK